MTTEPKASKDQVLCGIRILVHQVRTDGVLSDEERKPLNACLTALGLASDEIDAFLSERVELASALEAVTDPSVQRAVIRAAHAIARADGMNESERRVIDTAQAAWRARLEDAELEAELRRLSREDKIPMHRDPAEQAAHIERLATSWTMALADLALSSDEVEMRWRGRPTDISELTRRFMRGEATANEVAFKCKENLEKGDQEGDD